jgi:hypothetical protein
LLREALGPLTTLEADEPEVIEPQTDIVEVPDPIGEESSIIDDELEEHIGSSVFDVFLETQAAIESRLDDQLTDHPETPKLRIPDNLSSEPVIESREQEPQVFDIVQPEPVVESQETEPPETEPTAREPDTRYDRLFSQLRRRRRARQA